MKIRFLLERVVSSEKDDELHFRGEGKPSADMGVAGVNSRLRVTVASAKFRSKFVPGKSYTFEVKET